MFLQLRDMYNERSDYFSTAVKLVGYILSEGLLLIY